jgi:signal transduction histidine kinase
MESDPTGCTDRLSILTGLIKEQGIPGRTASGCAMATITHDNPSFFRFSETITMPEIQTETLFASQVSHEYVSALRKQLAQWTLTPGKRWPDFLRKEDSLKRHGELQLGIDLFRASKTDLPDSSRTPRLNDPPDFKAQVAQVRLALSKTPSDRTMSGHEIPFWGHDLRNQLTVLSQIELIAEKSPQTEFLDPLFQTLCEWSNHLSLANANGFFATVKNQLLPALDKILQDLLVRFPHPEEKPFFRTFIESRRLFGQMIAEFQRDLEGLRSPHQHIPMSSVLETVRFVFRCHLPGMENPIRNHCPEDPALMANPIDLVRIFENLAKNAKEAMSRSGQPNPLVEISASLADTIPSIPTDLLNTPFPSPSRFAIFQFTSNGGRIPEEKLKTLFSPKTTPSSDGRGLGLPGVARLLKSYGGNIIAENAGREEARFTIRFPLLESGPSPTPSTKHNPPNP